MIYIVEDDDNIRELVAYTLNSIGMECTGFGTPSTFWKAMEQKTPTLILLDIMLPEEDGLSILKKIRSSTVWQEIPIIMLTAKASEIDKVRGFEYGADDYVAKPFGVMELVARIKARLRKGNTATPDATHTVGNLCVNPRQHTVTVDGEAVTLTRKEFDVLCFLLENRGAVLTRDQILTRVWGYAFDGESRTVDVHMRTLRQKLGDAGALVETVRGIGYKIG